MKAWMIAEPGGIADLRLEDIAVPEAPKGGLLIRVETCGLNFADLLMLKGTYQSTPPYPFAPGAEVCGVVTAVGEGVARDWLGRRVVSYCGHGGFAEFITAPAEVCVAVDDRIDSVMAAAIPIAYGSSELALAHRARLKAGEWLLVSGAGGGVGLTAVEIGARMGAKVIGLARGAEKQAVAREKGASIVLDPGAYDLSGYALRDAILEASGDARMNVIYDAVGGDLMTAMLRTTAFEARVLPIGFASGTVPQFKANHLLVKNIDVMGFWWGDYFPKAPQVVSESFARLMDCAARGEITPHVSNIIDFNEAPAALTLLKERKAAGKVVLRGPASDIEI